MLWGEEIKISQESLYVKKEDEKHWEKVKELARKKDKSISVVAMSLIKKGLKQENEYRNFTI